MLKLGKAKLKYKKNGKTYWLHTVIKPIFENHEIVGYTTIQTNITNKKHVEQIIYYR